MKSMVVAPPDTAVSPNADVTLELVSLADATVKIRTRTGSAVVAMVATDDDMSYLKTSGALVCSPWCTRLRPPGCVFRSTAGRPKPAGANPFHRGGSVGTGPDGLPR